MFTDRLKLLKRFTSLSFGSKFLIGSLTFNVGLITTALAIEYNRRNKVEKIYQQALSEDTKSTSASNQISKPQKVSCFLEAQLFRQNCSYMTPDAITDNDTCHSLVIKLEECKNNLYDHIKVEKTPAMLPITEIINLPSWIDPQPLTPSTIGKD